jgi:hypothetical protein
MNTKKFVAKKKLATKSRMNTKKLVVKKISHKITNEREEISGHLCVRGKEMTKK